MADETNGSWIGTDAATRHRYRLIEIERTTAEIAQIKAGKPNPRRLAALERDLDILQTLEKFDAGNDD